VVVVIVLGLTERPRVYHGEVLNLPR